MAQITDAIWNSFSPEQKQDIINSVLNAPPATQNFSTFAISPGQIHSINPFVLPETEPAQGKLQKALVILKRYSIPIPFVGSRKDINHRKLKNKTP